MFSTAKNLTFMFLFINLLDVYHEISDPLTSTPFTFTDVT